MVLERRILGFWFCYLSSSIVQEHENDAEDADSIVHREVSRCERSCAYSRE